jgi:hypothetical protein
MGNYCHIEAHFPLAELSNDEQQFLVELRRRLPSGDEWLQIPWDERGRLQKAVHEQLGIPGEADAWQFVKQWQREGNWYVTDIGYRAPSPPFPRPLGDYPRPYSRRLPEVWLVAFTAPGRWQSESWSIYQTLSETRQHVRHLFNKLWGLFYIGEYHHEYTDAYDLREIRRKAPPGSKAHKRLRSVFSLFRLHDFTALHRLVLSQDLPGGTIIELDISDLLNEWSEEGVKALFRSDQHLGVLDAVEEMDLDALVNNRLLGSLSDYDEYVVPWLEAADAWCEAAMYLREQGDGE